MMRRLIFIGMLISLASCEPGDLVDLPSEPSKITVLSYNSVGYPWLIVVSPSAAPSDRSFIPRGLPDAVVNIYEDGNFLEQLTRDTLYADYSPAVFRSQTSSPQPGHQYMITVEAEGYTTVTSKYVQPEPVSADITFTLREKKPMIAQIVYSDGKETRFEYDSVNQWTFDIGITFTDPPGNNFYTFAINSAPTEDSLGLAGVSTGYMSVDGRPLGDPVLDGQVINDHDISGKRTTVKFTYTVDDYVSFVFLNYPDLNEKIPSWFKVSLITMNEAQYKFAIQTRKIQIAGSDPYAQPVTTYTNIENGLGVFGGHTPYSKTFHYKLE
jgi:hypothetical protein